MSVFADMDESGVRLTNCRMSWEELAAAIRHLGAVLCRGNIPADRRAEIKEHVERLHAAAASVEFFAKEWQTTERRVAEEVEAYQSWLTQQC